MRLPRLLLVFMSFCCLSANAQMQVMWNQVVTDTINTPYNGYLSATTDSSRNIYFARDYYSSADTAVYIQKRSPAGLLVWQKNITDSIKSATGYHGEWSFGYVSMYADQQQNIYLVTPCQLMNSTGYIPEDFFWSKLDGNGNLLSQKLIHSSTVIYYPIENDDNGNAYYTVEHFPGDSTGFGKIDANGNIAFEKLYPFPAGRYWSEPATLKYHNNRMLLNVQMSYAFPTSYESCATFASDASTGNLLWTYAPNSDSIGAGLIIEEGNHIYASIDDSLRTFDLNGNLLSTTPALPHPPIDFSMMHPLGTDPYGNLTTIEYEYPSYDDEFRLVKRDLNLSTVAVKHIATNCAELYFDLFPRVVDTNVVAVMMNCVFNGTSVTDMVPTIWRYDYSFSNADSIQIIPSPGYTSSPAFRILDKDKKIILGINNSCLDTNQCSGAYLSLVKIDDPILSLPFMQGPLSTAANDNNALELKLYPNPVGDTPLTVSYSLKQSAAVNLEVYDMLGRCLWKKKTTAISGSNREVIDIAKMGLAKGIYNVRLSSGNTMQSARFVH